MRQTKKRRNHSLAQSPSSFQQSFFAMSFSDSEPDEWNTPAITRKGAAELYALLTYTPPPPTLTKAGRVKDTKKTKRLIFTKRSSFIMD